MDKKNIIIILLSITSLFLFVGGLSAYSDYSDCKQSKTEVRVEKEYVEKECPECVCEEKDVSAGVADSVEDVLPTAREEFVDSCTSSGEVSVSTCDCMFEYMDANLTNDQIAKQNFDVEAFMFEAALSCY